MAEIPVPLHTGLHQNRGNRLGRRTGDAQNRNVRMILHAEIREVGNVLHHNAALQLFADLVRAFIERRHQMIAARFGRQISGNRPSQTPCANQHRVQAVCAEQKLRDLVQQHIYMIADALLPKAAEAVEILPHLRCGGAHHPRQLAGGYLYHTIAVHIQNIAVILGKPLDHRKGNLIAVGSLLCHVFFHRFLFL